jgi:hypothetical protein
MINFYRREHSAAKAATKNILFTARFARDAEDAEKKKNNQQLRCGKKHCLSTLRKT